MNGTEYRSDSKKPFAVGEQVYYAIEDRCSIFSGFGKIKTVEEYWCRVVSLDGADYAINKSDLYRTKEKLTEVFNYWLKDANIREVSNA